MHKDPKNQGLVFAGQDAQSSWKVDRGDECPNCALPITVGRDYGKHEKIMTKR